MTTETPWEFWENDSNIKYLPSIGSKVVFILFRQYDRLEPDKEYIGRVDSYSSGTLSIEVQLYANKKIEVPFTQSLVKCWMKFPKAPEPPEHKTIKQFISDLWGRQVLPCDGGYKVDFPSKFRIEVYHSMATVICKVYYGDTSLLTKTKKGPFNLSNAREVCLEVDKCLGLVKELRGYIV